MFTRLMVDGITLQEILRTNGYWKTYMGFRVILKRHSLQDPFAFHGSQNFGDTVAFVSLRARANTKIARFLRYICGGSKFCHNFGSLGALVDNDGGVRSISTGFTYSSDYRDATWYLGDRMFTECTGIRIHGSFDDSRDVLWYRPGELMMPHSGHTEIEKLMSKWSTLPVSLRTYRKVRLPLRILIRGKSIRISRDRSILHLRKVV